VVYNNLCAYSYFSAHVIKPVEILYTEKDENDSSILSDGQVQRTSPTTSHPRCIHCLIIAFLIYGQQQHRLQH